MKKLKVSTRTNVKNEKMKKIKNFLRYHPEGSTPKNIGFGTNINQNTVKSLLPQIPEVIKGPIRGLYKLVDESIHGELFDWNFHNAVIGCSIPNYCGERTIKTLSFNLVNFKFEIGAVSKRANLTLSTKHPVNISSIEVYSTLFIQLVNQYTGFSPNYSNIEIRSIEFNKDFTNLRLDGVNCITLRFLTSQFKAYQKKKGLRLEHKIGVSFPADGLISMLQNCNHNLEIHSELTTIKNEINTLIDSHKRIYQLMNMILEGMNGEKVS